MTKLQDQVVFITGASSGIGEALAREYFRQGAKVALLARRTDRLEALCEELDPFLGKVGVFFAKHAFWLLAFLFARGASKSAS